MLSVSNSVPKLLLWYGQTLDAHHGPESQAKNSSQTTPTQVNVKDSHMIDLKSCSNIRYDKRDAVHGVSYSIGDEEGWTPVIGRKKKRSVISCIYSSHLYKRDAGKPGTLRNGTERNRNWK